MAQPDDACGNKPKHVASHCKQKGICLPMKLCILKEKVCLIQIAKHCGMSHTNITNPDLYYFFSSSLALQPNVGFGLSNNIPPFFSICHQLSPSSHS
jgi:hypothetical protein